MAARKTLTGGSGDVKPQILTINATQSAADTATTKTFQMPIPRAGVRAGKATIMEILRVDFYPLLASTQAEADQSIYLALATAKLTGSTTVIQDPRVFAAIMIRDQITTSGVIATDSPFSVNLNDGAGNGFLVATDTISMILFSASTTVAVDCTCKILYRLVDVDITEYVGIVQGQQSAVGN